MTTNIFFYFYRRVFCVNYDKNAQKLFYKRENDTRVVNDVAKIIRVLPSVFYDVNTYNHI